MQIHRVRRLRQGDAADPCDFCDEPMEKGFELSGENVAGPRSGMFLRVCDDCLTKAKRSKIGFYPESQSL